jgi:hypothetical protein
MLISQVHRAVTSFKDPLIATVLPNTEDYVPLTAPQTYLNVHDEVIQRLRARELSAFCVRRTNDRGAVHLRPTAIPT